MGCWIKPALTRRYSPDCWEFRINLSCPEYSSMLFGPAVYKILFYLFFFSLNLDDKPCTGMGVLDVGHTDGGVTDPVVHHRVHTHGHAILGQHLTKHCHMMWICSSVRILPPEEEHLTLLSSNPLSDMIRYRVERRIFLLTFFYIIWKDCVNVMLNKNI